MPGVQIFPAELGRGRARNLLLERREGPNVTVEPFEHKRAKAEHRAELGLPALIKTTATPMAIRLLTRIKTGH